MKPIADLFDRIVTDTPHVAFTRFRDSAFHADARQLMNETAARMGNPDGDFVKEFQSEGFHGRVFELASYAYLESLGGRIEHHDRPDFVLHAGEHRIAFEAVTANPTASRFEDIALDRMEPLPFATIVDKCRHELPIRLGASLVKKVEKRYWELPHCQGIPIVLMICPFHEPGCQNYIDESVATYLYGVERLGDWTEHNGIFVRQRVIREHQFNGRTIRSDVFATPGAEHLSAVLWCSQFTLSRFARIAAESISLPENHVARIWGWYATGTEPGDAEQYEYFVGDPDAPPEAWSRGVTLFHNPTALHPLPEGVIEASSTFRLREGQLVRDVDDFHPFLSFMRIVALKDEPRASVPKYPRRASSATERRRHPER